MPHLIVIALFFTSMASNIIFEFNQKADLSRWYVIDDVVMGGKSSGSLTLNSQGFGVFKGSISLANNGGFSSTRYKFKKKSVQEFSKFLLTVKGDKRKYQFRVKANSSDYYSYVSTFETNGNWQQIEVPFKNMYPSFRGRKLEKPNFSHFHIEEIAFLIGNKSEENFELVIDKVELR